MSLAGQSLHISETMHKLATKLIYAQSEEVRPVGTAFKRYSNSAYAPASVINQV
jgi:hypothetical protein